ncbi:MAG: oligosaccharide flippase family protein [Paracoccus sp. (in: a-proteobacteria)]|nr:oligosaccharide flippase family protein [Paracoccus sp. (in: a-proteobacteria)]
MADLSSQQPQPASRGRKTAGDAAISVAERVISQISQFTIFLVAARLLGPAEFGVFALASACAILLLNVAEVAWVPFIMSREGDERLPLQVLLVAILNGIAFGLIGASAALAGRFFGLSGDLALLMMLFSLWIALANATSAQKGVLIWMDRMKASALCEIAGELSGLAVALYALHRGHGIFALVYGRLVAQTVVLSLTFLATRRLPRFGLSRADARDLWRFSVQFFSSRIMVQARLQFVTLIIGMFLGPAAVGFYRAAERLVGALSELIVVPAQLLAWTLLRRARDFGDPEGREARIKRQTAQHIKLMTALGTPLFLWLMLLNTPLITGLLGPEWAPAAPLVAILGFARMVLIPSIITEPLLSIAGAIRYLPGFVARVFLISVVLTLAAVPFGVTAIAASQALTGMFVMVATFWLFEHRLGLGWRDLVWPLRRLLMPLGCGVLAVVLIARGLALPDMPVLALAVIAGLGGGLAYGAALAIFDQAIFQQITALLRRSPASRQEAAP